MRENRSQEVFDARGPSAQLGPPLNRPVFIDRDGVICENRRDHVKSWEEFVFLPGALEALARLARSDWHIIIVTNQAIVNRHVVPLEIVDGIHARMVRAIECAGGRVDGVMYCPHRPDEECACRKPEPGLLLEAARKFGLNLGRSCLIGDSQSDMQAGRAAGCRLYLVLTGRGHQQLARCEVSGQRDFAVVQDLGVAVDEILDLENRAGPSLHGFARSGGCGQ